jgi:hypothetical protein
MKDKGFILGEIRRTAALNDGKPVGQARFRTETGIATHEWCGVHWARWSDALQEAGFEPLQWGAALEEDALYEGLAKLIRKYHRLPTAREIQMEKRADDAAPSADAIRGRLGSRSAMIRKAAEYFGARNEYQDVSAIISSEVEKIGEQDMLNNPGTGKPESSSGYVYLVKSGKLYKIGCTENHWRRKSELHKQTAEGIVEIHTIAAIDDPQGIERYWHERFADRREHGEWFDLSAEDINAFKKRKFM